MTNYNLEVNSEGFEDISFSEFKSFIENILLKNNVDGVNCDETIDSEVDGIKTVNITITSEQFNILDSKNISGFQLLQS